MLVAVLMALVLMTSAQAQEFKSISFQFDPGSGKRAIRCARTRKVCSRPAE
jgi:hypothetical protein